MGGFRRRPADLFDVTRGVSVPLRLAEDALVAEPQTTPFRLHYEHCRSLDLEGQVQECADHLQHPEVLLMEFFESYHLIERTWSPEQSLRPPETDELVLESFHEALEIRVEGGARGSERLVCLSGAVSPVPDAEHPAISRRGLDYVGLLAAPSPRLVLGVVQASKDETPYVLLLRALNCFAELSPPLRVAQLGHELLGEPVSEDVHFDLQLGINEPSSSGEWGALVELSRDMAELFVRQIGEYRQFEGTLGRVGCLEIEPVRACDGVAMRTIWEI
ncbi:MAG: hypothetical protein GY937_00880 [bacterium]|nr:hypothetical protein [bacterium]